MQKSESVVGTKFGLVLYVVIVTVVSMGAFVLIDTWEYDVLVSNTNLSAAEDQTLQIINEMVAKIDRDIVPHKMNE